MSLELVLKKKFLFVDWILSTEATIERYTTDVGLFVKFNKLGWIAIETVVKSEASSPATLITGALLWFAKAKGTRPMMTNDVKDKIIFLSINNPPKEIY